MQITDQLTNWATIISAVLITGAIIRNIRIIFDAVSEWLTNRQKEQPSQPAN